MTAPSELTEKLRADGLRIARFIINATGGSREYEDICAEPITRALATARRDALEEAEKRCAAIAQVSLSGEATTEVAHHPEFERGARACLEAIRALGKEDGE